MRCTKYVHWQLASEVIATTRYIRYIGTELLDVRNYDGLGE